jgi:hypothetical protein
MSQFMREQIISSLQNDWGGYVNAFYRLTPEAQAIFLTRQGYARLADILAHVVAWWKDGHQAIGQMVSKPSFSSPDVDVDWFNARAVAGVRTLDEAAVIASFEAMRRQMVQLVEGLPPSAFENQHIVDRLYIEVIGHYGEHTLAEPGDR